MGVQNRVVPTGYKKHESANYFRCFYCGQLGNVLDHFPPVSRRHDINIFGVNIEKILVRSCHECNAYLASSIQPNLEERKKHAISRFEIHKSSDDPEVDRKREIKKIFYGSFHKQRRKK